MKLGVLFSGGKDSCYAAWLAKEMGYEIACLITIISENKESFMFHTPSVEMTAVQAGVMNIPLVTVKTPGHKESELRDLESAVKEAKTLYGIEGIVTGAVGSVYQAARVQAICNKLCLECFNPLWQKDQFELLNELVVKNGFEAIVTGVFAYPLTNTWLGRKIDERFIGDVRLLHGKYNINPAGEGGEFESFVLNCPLFNRPLELAERKVFGSGNSFRMEVVVK
jgi:ABC transporter with metal-binding/Fe-S-binding domain ATP-binding protein